MSMSSLCEKAYQITNAKTYVFSDSVFCVGKMGDDPIATWKDKIKIVFGKRSLEGYESHRRYADGVRVEHIPRNHSVGSLREDSKSNERSTVWAWALRRQDHLHVDVQRHWMESKKGTKNNVKFRGGHRSFLVPGSKEKWYGTFTDKPDGSWDRMAEEMMVKFSGSGHPIFRAFSAIERGQLRSKGGGTKSIHFNGSHENIELLHERKFEQLSEDQTSSKLCSDADRKLVERGQYF